MIASRLKVKEVCDKLVEVNHMQILIDLVQDDIETLVYKDEATPDEVYAMSYRCELLQQIYSDKFPGDINYLTNLIEALNNWGVDLEVTNRTLGIEPNQ